MSVGYKLYREVRDFAPQDWSAAELVVAWLIADDANDHTRRSWIPLELLCARARLKQSAVRAALAKMAASGYEFRVVHGYGKDGRPMFATKGHAVDYAVPDMLKGATILAALPVDNWSESRQDSGAYPDAKAPGNEPKAPANSPKGARILAPLSSDLLSNTSTEEAGVITPSVEGSQTCGQPKPDLAATNGHKPSRLAAWLATRHAKESL